MSQTGGAGVLLCPLKVSFTNHPTPTPPQTWRMLRVDNCVWLVLSSPVGSGAQTQAVRLDGKHSIHWVILPAPCAVPISCPWHRKTLPGNIPGKHMAAVSNVDAVQKQGVRIAQDSEVWWKRREICWPVSLEYQLHCLLVPSHFFLSLKTCVCKLSAALSLLRWLCKGPFSPLPPGGTLALLQPWLLGLRNS